MFGLFKRKPRLPPKVAYTDAKKHARSGNARLRAELAARPDTQPEILYFLSGVTNMSVYVTNTASVIGIGVGIDYALFVVTRFREELRRGRTVADAIPRTLATSGRSVTLSGLTVIVALFGMFLVNIQAFRSMAIGSTVARVSDRDEYDLDVIVYLNIDDDNDPEAVLSTLHAAIHGEPGSRYYDMTIRRTRCVCVSYHDGMHVDLTVQ